MSGPLVTRIRAELADHADAERGAATRAYLKSTMPCLGVRIPQVRSIARAAARECAVTDPDVLAADSRELFDDATHREHRHAALALVALPPARGRPELIDLHEHFALTGAWWDLVDETAHRIAELHDAHPEHTAATVRRWSRADSFWLRRLAIISQLGRKDRVDNRLLAEVIGPNLDDREFFIRKAIGWSLRDYARVNPGWVRRFVSANETRLSALSRREAVKHLGG